MSKSCRPTCWHDLCPSMTYVYVDMACRHADMPRNKSCRHTSFFFVSYVLSMYMYVFCVCIWVWHELFVCVTREMLVASETQGQFMAHSSVCLAHSCVCHISLVSSQISHSMRLIHMRLIHMMSHLTHLVTHISRVTHTDNSLHTHTRHTLECAIEWDVCDETSEMWHISQLFVCVTRETHGQFMAHSSVCLAHSTVCHISLVSSHTSHSMAHSSVCLVWVCHELSTARSYESCKIFKGRPRRNAFSNLVHRQYKSFPPDRFLSGGNQEHNWVG